jgi:hypothetical protein
VVIVKSATTPRKIMRVTTEHRQQTTGLGSSQSQFVDCLVQFSEEEKAIIRVRGLQDHIIVLDPPSPPPTHREYLTAGILRGFSPLAGVVGVTLFVSSMFIGGGYALLGVFLFFGSPLAWAVGFLMDRSIDVRFTHPKQHVSIRSMLAGPFVVYSPDPAYSDLVVDQIRDRLTHLKYTISGSADERKKQTYEL